MNKNQKTGTSKRKSDHQKVPYSPTKDIVECERLNIERKIKIAEIEYRFEVYGKTMLRRYDELKSDPSLNHAHIRRFENYQLAEASKRRDEIKLIDKQMTKITKNIAQNFDI